MNTRSPHLKARIMESRALRLNRPYYVWSRRRTPVKRDANIKSRILGSLNPFVLAASRRTDRQRRAFRVVSHLWAISTVRPLRLLGVLLVLYAMVGWNISSPAEVPPDAVRVLLWLFVSRHRRVDRRRGAPRADNAGSAGSDGPEEAREGAEAEPASGWWLTTQAAHPSDARRGGRAVAPCRARCRRRRP